MRVRVAGIIPMNNGICLMHRDKVLRNKDFKEYYTIPGGGQEDFEDEIEGVKREIKEEFGIIVNVVKKLYEITESSVGQRESFYLCEYVSGEFGTGDGPEFNNDPAYVDAGVYIPEIVKFEDLESIRLLPEEIKEKIINDIEIIKKYNYNDCDIENN